MSLGLLVSQRYAGCKNCKILCIVYIVQYISINYFGLYLSFNLNATWLSHKINHFTRFAANQNTLPYNLICDMDLVPRATVTNIKPVL